MLVRSGRCTLLGVALVAIGGCQAGGGSQHDGWVRIPSGSTIILNQDLDVPTGWAHVNIQAGQVIAHDDVQPYDDSCSFVMRDLSTSERPRVIEAGTFVTGAVFLPRDTGGDRTQRVFKMHIPLTSVQQPNVTSMDCGFVGDPMTDRYMSIARIEQTLGALATVELSKTIPE